MIRARAVAASTAAVLVVIATSTGCTYDFDAPFSEPTSAETTGAAGGAGTTTSTTTTTTGQAEGGGGAGGAGGAGGERCDDGVDDDGDGDVDCADASCVAAGFTCVAEAPAGFEGPVALLRGASVATLSCGGAFADEILAGGIGALVADAPTCAPCGCEAPAGQTCTATLAWFTDGACATAAGEVTVSPEGCVDATDVTIGSARASAGVVDGGACASTGGEPTFAEATYEAAAKLCGAPLGGGCASGVCTTLPEAPFDAQLCVYRAGTGGCEEAGPFSVAIEMHGGVDDQRACSSCSCSDPTGATCAGSTAIYRNNDGCNGAAVTLPHDGSCNVALGIASHATTLAVDGGACTASGGAPSGQAFPVEPITLCCLP